MVVDKEISIKRLTAYKMLCAAAIIVLLFAGMLFVISNKELAYSTLIGGFAFIFPNVIFTWFSLRTPARDANPNRTLLWFFVGEAVKVVLTLLMFTSAIILVADINIGLMFVSYGLVLFLNLTGLAFLMKK